MRVLILGTGPAGLAAAERLRALERPAGQDRLAIEMVSDERHPPYSPPAMADHFLTGRETTLYWRGRDVLDRLRVTPHMGAPVKAVHPVLQRVELGDGKRIDYDRLILALVLRALGLAVTMVSRRWVMPRALDAETGGIVLDALRGRGVEVVMDQAAAGFEGETRVEALRLASGKALAADVYVAATGVKPNCEYLAGSGIALGWGVQVDDRLRTNLPDIYAAGDLAETRDRLTGERYVHAYFPNAVDQGKAVAEHLLGFDTRYPGAESINSLRHLGVPLVAAGTPRGEELRLRDGPVLRKIFVADGRITGFRLAGDIRGAGVLRSLMLGGLDVTRYGKRLLDPSFGVGTLALSAMGMG